MGTDYHTHSFAMESHTAGKRLKSFAHTILLNLTRSTPIWGYPAIISGDGYPFINQRAKQVPTIMLDVRAEKCDAHTIRTLGLILTESIRALEDNQKYAQRVQMLTLNNDHGSYSFIIQSMDSHDLGELPYFLDIHRYHILKTAFAIVDALCAESSATAVALQ